jgi:hypothetical protein
LAGQEKGRASFIFSRVEPGTMEVEKGMGSSKAEACSLLSSMFRNDYGGKVGKRMTDIAEHKKKEEEK